ncbi:hypothetical protein MNV49_002138 [Pseudohyphozyma bogoriensis]|nr:hypothetical protein MNV49_002138 [Pseudohyphozyma bogoriensis]
MSTIPQGQPLDLNAILGAGPSSMGEWSEGKEVPGFGDLWKFISGEEAVPSSVNPAGQGLGLEQFPAGGAILSDEEVRAWGAAGVVIEDGFNGITIANTQSAPSPSLFAHAPTPLHTPVSDAMGAGIGMGMAMDMGMGMGMGIGMDLNLGLGGVNIKLEYPPESGGCGAMYGEESLDGGGGCGDTCGCSSTCGCKGGLGEL